MAMSVGFNMRGQLTEQIRKAQQTNQFSSGRERAATEAEAGGVTRIRVAGDPQGARDGLNTAERGFGGLIQARTACGLALHRQICLANEKDVAAIAGEGHQAMHLPLVILELSGNIAFAQSGFYAVVVADRTAMRAIHGGSSYTTAIDLQTV